MKNIYHWLIPMWRLVQLLLHVLVGLLLSAFIITPAIWWNRQRNHQRVRIPIVRWWFLRITRILRIKITLHGSLPQATALFVTNHITWLDIIVIGSLVRASFVAKSGVRAWPVLGWMCAVAGTLFIHRGNLESAISVMEALSAHLRAGKSIVVFPEGTSTDGQNVKPFKRRLFAPALEVSCPIQPVALLYPQLPSADNLGIMRPNLVIPFIGEDNLLSNILRVIGLPEISVQVHFGPLLYPQPGQDSRELAHIAWQQVQQTVTSHWQ